MRGEELIRPFRDEAMRLPHWLRSHTERVVIESSLLAKKYGLNNDKLSLERIEAASWGHDLYRAYEPKKLLDLAGDLGIPISETAQAAPILLHGPIAAARARRDWGFKDEIVLESISWHTTGHPAMSVIAKTVFLADKIEPEKVSEDPGLIPIHILAIENREAALLAFLEKRLSLLLLTGQPIDPKSIQIRNKLRMDLDGKKLEH